MNINIYYGGRGLVDDPTLFVINKIQEVLGELNVNVNRYNLYEMKNTISTLSQTVTEADGIILATTIEWIGMGGYMQTLLDACWLYTDKTSVADKYMFPVVMSRTYGEKEVVLALNNSWEIIGGKNGASLSAFVDDTTEFEFNAEYKDIIEKYAEDIYRTISKKPATLPSSSQTIKKNIIKDTVRFTPQESEQLSKYVSDDAFVRTQKEDIEVLANIYKELLNDEEKGGEQYYIDVFNDHFNFDNTYTSTYMLQISDKDKSIVIKVNGQSVNVDFGENKSADVIGRLSKDTFDQIVNGKITFHRAFMTGAMTAKGNLKTLKMLDEIFNFSK
ncbi:MAG: SCP2 sterol-binding domain-containing protein [Lachnospira sp.]